jgi:hypothetical protein
MANTRLYRVVTPTKTHLVEATNPQRAVSFVASRTMKCDIPAQHEVFAMAKAGIEIERTTGKPLSDETRNAVAQEDLEVA